MKKFSAVLVFLVLSMAFFNGAAFADELFTYVPPDLENLVVFGDSLSDTGNILALTGGSTPDMNYYWQGRFSNGPTWCEVMADFMGIDNDVILMGTPITNFIVKDKPFAAVPPITSYGTPIFFNNAFGGADTSSGFTDFGFQIGAWEELNYTVPDKTLVVVWIGGNDFLGMGPYDEPEYVIATAVNNIYNGLEDIVDLGATDIAVCNLPNLGDTPLYHGTITQTLATSLTLGFNQALDYALAGFAANYSDVSIYPVDVFAMGEQTHENPGLYGVTNLYDAALYEGETFDSADGYLYWDNVHPTRAAHKQIAAQVYGTIFIGEADAKYIKSEGTTGATIGINGENCEVNSVEFANVGETAKTDRPEDLLYGLLDITATLDTPGDVAEIVIYLPEALPEGYTWYKHVHGDWINFAAVYQDTNGLQGAKISEDRKKVTLYILDNGEYDVDDTLGIVQDPVAAGTAANSKPTYAGTEDEDCFVRSTQNGSTAVMPLILLGLFIGLGLAVRRIR